VEGLAGTVLGGEVGVEVVFVYVLIGGLNCESELDEWGSLLAGDAFFVKALDYGVVSADWQGLWPFDVLGRHI
jgi:hypothetical protein